MNQKICGIAEAPGDVYSRGETVQMTQLLNCILEVAQTSSISTSFNIERLVLCGHLDRLRKPQGSGSYLCLARAVPPWLDQTGVRGHHRRCPSRKWASLVVHGGGAALSIGSDVRLPDFRAPFKPATPGVQIFPSNLWVFNRCRLLWFLFFF